MMKNIFKEIKVPFLSLLTLFVFSLWLGYLSGVDNPKEARVLFGRFFETFSLLKEVNIIAMFFFIFVNNVVKYFTVFLLGTFFGIIPVLFVIMYSMLIGIVSSGVLTEYGLKYLFTGTTPYGILEIPALLITTSYGLQLGRRYYRKLKYREPFKPFLLRLTEKMFRYVLPILALVSFIETFITMTILRSL